MKSSELILNDDGSLYHLKLLPGDLAKCVLLVGDPDRVAIVSEHFENVDIKRAKREFVTHTGSYKGKRMSVISTGIGADNIDIAINEIDALFNIDLPSRTLKSNVTPLTFVRLGTSGALHSSIDVDTVLVSHAAIGLDALGQFYPATKSVLPTGIQEILESEATSYYHARGDDELVREFDPGPWVNITLTCPGFYGPQGRQLRIESKAVDTLLKLAEFTDPTVRVSNVEMETAAIYLLSELLGHRALSLNVILANRSTGTYSARPAQAVDQMIEESLRKLALLI